MPECISTSMIQSFHDGQLPPERARAAERHVAECEACATELRRLRELSRVLASARPAAGIRPDELARLHGAIERVERIEEGQRRGILRLVVGLSAVAASILIISTAWIYDGPTPATRIPNVSPNRVAMTPESWERYAVGRFDPPPQAAPTGTALGPNAEQDTIKWMIEGMGGSQAHGNP